MKRILLTAVASGLIAGLLLSTVQFWTVTPMILEAETYETRIDAGPHAESDDTWAPTDGLERNFFTGLSNIGAGIGFSLLIIVGLMFHPGRTWWHGLIWGACGVLVLYLVPTVAYPPALPGTLQSDVLVRQMWWLATVEGTIFGLALVFFAKNAMGWITGLIVLALPHIIGAPPGEAVLLAPQALADRFFTINVLTNALFWLMLGFMTVQIYRRVEVTSRHPASEPAPAVEGSRLHAVRSKYWALNSAYRVLGIIVVLLFFFGVYMSHSHARLTYGSASYLDRFGRTVDDHRGRSRPGRATSKQTLSGQARSRRDQSRR